MLRFQVPSNHLILFDDQCALCWRCVNIAIQLDKSGLLLFAPLKGVTAKERLPFDLFEKNSFVLIENFKGGHSIIRIYGKALFRIFWLLGGFWKVVGLLHFLPGWLIDPLYRFIASRRGRCRKGEVPMIHPEKFLP